MTAPFADFAAYKAAMSALQAGTATAEQQRALHTLIENMKKAHARDLREAERDSRDAYSEGRSDAASEARGEPYGTY
jgi:hypothetical protein